MDDIKKVLEKKVMDLIADEPEVFLVDITIKPTNNIRVFLDADSGMSLERLIKCNRKLYKELEEGTIFPGGDFSLEVSSPGLDEPLKLHRQYQKNVGRYVDIVMQDGTAKEGKLLEANEKELIIEEEKGKGKKKEVIQHNIPFDHIKTTKIQIKI